MTVTMPITQQAISRIWWMELYTFVRKFYRLNLRRYFLQFCGDWKAESENYFCLFVFCFFVFLSFCFTKTCRWRGRRCWVAGLRWGLRRWGKSQSGPAPSGTWPTFNIRHCFLWLYMAGPSSWSSVSSFQVGQPWLKVTEWLTKHHSLDNEEGERLRIFSSPFFTF